jgi:hypothetical protein
MRQSPVDHVSRHNERPWIRASWRRTLEGREWRLRVSAGREGNGLEQISASKFGIRDDASSES